MTQSTSDELSEAAMEVKRLLEAVEPLLLDFVSRAELKGHKEGESSPEAIPRPGALVDYVEPRDLIKRLNFALPSTGRGQDGVTDVLERILKNSVNTWHQGFMDKLYASTNAVGVVSELILATLNTNLHVYKVSPALTVIEKSVAKALASLFGMKGPYAGGITQPGGSASNLTALVIARNSVFPETKSQGCAGRKLVLFTSAHGHYSFEKAAQITGLGSEAARSVPVDSRGCMIPSELEQAIKLARQDGCEPFFVNATAGTTVLGSYDPFTEISAICKREGLWFHIDASWGGPVVFSSRHKSKMQGSDQADSLSVNPHKMMGVPVTCSFLLASDLRKFWKSNTLPAAYLFHSGTEPDESLQGSIPKDPSESEIWDLADLTLQCGRKGDSLKLALGWIYYGTLGYENKINEAFSVAAHMADLVAAHKDLTLVSENPPPCLQVCFYYTPGKQLAATAVNSKRTEEIVDRLLRQDFLIDYAPGEHGLFFRVVVSLETRRTTVETLVERIVELGKQAA